MVNLSHKKKAFTLAELLVAMLVFGVIAAMLIPNVSNNAEKNLFATQLLKVQNDLQQAFLLLMSENQGTLQALCSGDSSSECLRNLIAEKLETKVKYSGATRETNCDAKLKPDKNPCIQQEAFEDRAPIFLNKKSVPNTISSHNSNSYTAANLTNGATVSVVFSPVCETTYILDKVKTNPDGTTEKNADGSDKKEPVFQTDYNTCGYVEIDINAAKKPNIVGKDIHYFWIVDKDGLIPFGEIDNSTCGTFDNTGKETVNVLKSENNETQFGCTFKLVQDGKINYY